MTSVLDESLFSSMRDIPLSSLKGSPPTRVTSIDHGMGRDSWALKQNIWQTAPRMFDYLSRDDRQRDLPKRNNKVTMTDIVDVPDSAARASTYENRNNPLITANGSYSNSASTTLSGRSSGPLVSPTRLRNNGILVSDTGPSRTNFARSSLLSGSSPDDELPGSLGSSSAYQTTLNQVADRSLPRINVREPEEFVPQHLRDPEGQSARGHRSQPFGMNELSFDARGSAAINVSGSMYGTSSLRPREQSGTISSLFDRPVAGANGVSASGGASNHEARQTVSCSERGSLEGSSRSSSQHNWTTRHNAKYADQHVGTSQERKPSVLRPDVASYKPTNLYGNIGSYLTSQSDGIAKHDNRTYLPGAANMYSYPINQQAFHTNVDAFNINSLNEHLRLNDAHNGSRSDRASPSGVVPIESADQAPQYVERNTRNHGHDREPMTNSRMRMANEDVSSQYLLASGRLAYDTEPRYSVGVNVPSTSRYQHYPGETPMGVGNPARVGVYAPEPNSVDVVRSTVLEEFRAYHKNKKFELKEIYGHIVEFSGDQTGSRFIQTKLEQANSDEKDQIFSELQTNARQLMSDVFGNYVIQKMFEYGNQAQKKILASHMQGYVLKLSLQAYGCRCVQKALEHILTDQQAALIKELDGHVIPVVESQHGNHVIQKAIECIPGEHIQFIVDAHKNQVVRLAKHPFGCRIIQRMLEYCLPHPRRAVLDELHAAVATLIDDQFGNYVIQCMIRKCSPSDRQKVIQFVQRELLYYSMHKFASNVVEKAIQFAEEEQRNGMIRYLTYTDPNTNMPSPILTLLKDQYGNYVLQTVLKAVQGPNKYGLAIELRHHLDSIKHANRGRQVAAMAEIVNNIIAEYSPSSASTGLQTPRTPTSLHSERHEETTLLKAVEMIPTGYTTREPHHKYEYA